MFNKGVMRQKVKRIQSKLNRIASYDVCKISSLAYFDKT